MTDTERILAMDLGQLTQKEIDYLHELNRRAQLRIVWLYIQNKQEEL